MGVESTRGRTPLVAAPEVACALSPQVGHRDPGRNGPRASFFGCGGLVALLVGVSGLLRPGLRRYDHYAWSYAHSPTRRLITEDGTIFVTEGTLPDGLSYRAELWQLELSYHITIFIPRKAGQSPDDIIRVVEDSLVTFCGTRYVRVEPVVLGGEELWSYNAVVCDDREQYVSAMPLMPHTSTFNIWYGERQVEIRR